MRLRTLSTLLSDVLSHLPGAEYERAKCEGLAAQVQEQRAHIEDLARRLEYTTRQKDEAEEAHVDAYEIRLDKIEGERDAWQRSHGTLAREKEQLKVELHALRARVAELQAGEPVGWLVKTASGENFMDVKPHLGADRGVFATPLYAAPKPAAPAYGVGEACFGVLIGSPEERSFVYQKNTNVVPTRPGADALVRLFPDRNPQVVRIIAADAPVVDVAKIREVIADLGASYPRLFASESAHLLRAAIGEGA